MAQQQLNRADVRSRFQQMHSERVTHRMGADWLADAGESARLLAGEFDCASADRLAGNVTLEEPPLRPHCSPVVAQRLQQLGREHHVSILLSLALIDTDNHPLAVDIGEL